MKLKVAPVAVLKLPVLEPPLAMTSVPVWTSTVPLLLKGVLFPPKEVVPVSTDFRNVPELLNAWELGNLLDIAETVAASALNRKESRGGHSREDFPERDDVHWLKHTLIAKKNGKLEINYKPVVITKYQPKARVY